MSAAEDAGAARGGALRAEAQEAVDEHRALGDDFGEVIAALVVAGGAGAGELADGSFLRAAVRGHAFFECELMRTP